MATETWRITTLAGVTHEVTLDVNAKVSDFKREIEQLLQIPAPEQRLLSGATILDDELQPFEEDLPRALQLARVPKQHLPDFLVQHGHPSTLQGLKEALYLAAREDNAVVCLEIVTHPDFQVEDLNDHFDYDRMLSILAQGGLFEAFKELLEDPRYGDEEGLPGDAGYLALRNAAKRGLPLHCRAILDSPRVTAQAATVPPSGSEVGTVLHHAANENIARLLLSSNGFLAEEALNREDRHGCTPLHYATSEGVAVAILSHPEFRQVNALDSSGRTALHNAPNPSICRAILAHPDFASVNARDRQARTALHCAAHCEPIALALLQGAPGLDVNALDDRGRTALFYARNGAVSQALFGAGFTALNAQDADGQNALHTCKEATKARAILEHPDFASADLPDHEGNSPLTFAARMRLDAVVLAILEAGQRGGAEIGVSEAVGYAHALGSEAREALEQAARARGLHCSNSDAPANQEEAGTTPGVLVWRGHLQWLYQWLARAFCQRA